MLLENLTKKHPFFQLGYSLIAKGIHSKAPDIAQEAIKKAATHALSRNALRKVIENDMDWLVSSSSRFVEQPIDSQGSTGQHRYPLSNFEDELIASIESNSQAGFLDEQLEIIDNFIKNEPRINKVNLHEHNEAEVIDLSENSTVLKAPLCTESFAKILIKQSKITEAKEVYKTLMLQNPEKSTYFAAKIDEINRKYIVE